MPEHVLTKTAPLSPCGADADVLLVFVSVLYVNRIQT